MADAPLEYTDDGWCVVFRDDVTGREIHALDEGDVMRVREVIDAEKLIDENAAMRAVTAGQRHGDGLSLAARIPINVFHNRLGDAVLQGDQAYLARWLNDPDHAKFRVRDGRI